MPSRILITCTLLSIFTSFAHAQQVQSLVHDTNANSNSLAMVDTDTYALAYSTTGGVGQLSTFSISANGLMITEEQSIQHDTAGTHTSLVQVNASIYALAYTGPDTDGFIQTFAITADGSTIGELTNLEHDLSRASDNSMIALDTDTFVLAYSGNGNAGEIATFTIAADGLTVNEVASLTHAPGGNSSNSLVQVDANTFALAYTDENSDGVVKTFDIAANGTGITQVDVLIHEPASGIEPVLTQVDADTYALAYNRLGIPRIKTFTISASGMITEVTFLDHDIAFGGHFDLIAVDADTYLLAFEDGNNEGMLKTFTIPASGTPITQVDTLTHDANRAQSNSLVQVDADTFALAYSGDSSDGLIKTFSVSAMGNVPVELLRFGVE